MLDKGASVLAKIKNKSRENGKSNQLCLQLFCQEEFLRRVEKSKYSNNFVLKGGLFLYAISEFDSRVTVDIDFLLQKIPNTPEKLGAMINEIILSDTSNDFVTFDVKNITSISVDKKYPGVHVDIIAKIKNTKTPIGIDFGFGDIIVPEAIKRKIPTQLPEFNSPIINTYSIETSIAEKLDAILNLMEFSSRMKDYYDIYYLASNYDFDGLILYKAINETFNNRERKYEINQFNEIVAFGTNEGMMKKWSAFCIKIKIDSDFQLVLRTIDEFLGEVFALVLLDIPFEKRWSAKLSCWQ